MLIVILHTNGWSPFCCSPTWNNRDQICPTACISDRMNKIYEAVAFKTQGTRQQKVVIPERWEVCGARPVIAPVSCLDSFRDGAGWAPEVKRTELRAWGGQGTRQDRGSDGRELHRDRTLEIYVGSPHPQPGGSSLVVISACLWSSDLGWGKDHPKVRDNSPQGSHKTVNRASSNHPCWKTPLMHGTLGRLHRRVCPQ